MDGIQEPPTCLIAVSVRLYACYHIPDNQQIIKMAEDSECNIFVRIQWECIYPISTFIKSMNVIKINEYQIEKLRIDTAIKFVTNTQLKTSPVIKGIFKWGVQVWALTINDKIVPVQRNENQCLVFVLMI